MNGIKRFFKNKNTVTILGVVIILALLYFVYNKQIEDAVRPVMVPVAKQTIEPRTRITSDMVKTIRISSIALTENVYRTTAAVVGKYTNVNTIVPKDSMFYKEAVVDNADFKDTIFQNLKDGEIPYLFSVNLETTYGNSIYPKNIVDVYMKAVDDTGKVVVGKLIEDVEVLAVRDKTGKDVFADTINALTPSYFVFAVDEEIHILLRKAKYISTNNIELFPVPRGGNYVSEGETKVSTEYLKEFINSKSIILEGQDGTDVEDVEEETSSTTDVKTTK